MEKTRIPQIFGIMSACIAIIGFFLPFISATPEYSKYFDTRANEKVYETTDITVGDMKDMSLFEYAKVYAQAGEEIYHDQTSGMIYVVIIGAIVVAAIIALFCTLGKKPILMMLCSIIMGGAFYIINWDFIDRRIMPNSHRVWGIAHSLYYPCTAILLICAIWLLIAKRKAKKESAL